MDNKTKIFKTRLLTDVLGELTVCVKMEKHEMKQGSVQSKHSQRSNNKKSFIINTQEISRGKKQNQIIHKREPTKQGYRANKKTERDTGERVTMETNKGVMNNYGN